MKKIASLFVVAAIAFVAAIPTTSQVKFGLKAGVAVNSLKFNQDLLDSDNRAGFTGGAMLEFTVPVVGVGFDASVMYVHRSAGTDLKVINDAGVATDIPQNKRDYIDIPINVKWKFNIPVIASVVKPYIATGPAFAFLVSKNDAKDFFNDKKCDISWNVGAGIELLSHLQIGASYGFGLTKAVESVGIDNVGGGAIEGKNRYWTITAAYLF